MNNLNASIGLPQLDRCLDNVQKRKENFLYLRENLDKRFFDHDKYSSYYLCTIILQEDSRLLLQELSSIGATYHYPPLHVSTLFQSQQM